MKIQLDPQQKVAAETDSKRALVLAGAGSGKTRVLVERIAYLIEQKQVSPYEIMSFSFTRKASEEIRTRIEARIGQRVNRMTLGTMHGIALNMLKSFGEEIGLKPNNITVYSQWEFDYLLREVAIDTGFYGKSWKKIKKGEVNEMFADYYEKGIEPDEFHKGHALFKAFIARCRENNSITYGGLLIGFKLLIPIISKLLHIKYIFVDEAQDIDPLQWEIIERMCAGFDAKLFAVGDLDQSIYEFRGACPEYLIKNEKTFSIYKIETNYRSQPNIVNAANRLIEHNAVRIEKTMVPNVEHKPGSLQAISGMDSDGIVSYMATFNSKQGMDEICILARNHFLLKKVDQLMDDADIKHTYIGKQTALTNSEEFRRFHAFLKLIVNPYDNFSFLLIKDIIGVPGVEYKQIRLKSIQEGKSHFQVWLEYAYEVNPFANFFRTDAHLQTLAVATFGIKYMAIGSAPYPDEGWGCDVEGVFKFIFTWLVSNPNGTIKQYLDWLSTYDIQDEVKEDEDEGIKLMTIHASKGLEFQFVFLAGCNEGILPSKKADASGEIESERRLMYVAMTRAERKLILGIRPTKTEKDGRVYESPASRFVEEAYGLIENSGLEKGLADNCLTDLSKI